MRISYKDHSYMVSSVIPPTSEIKMQTEMPSHRDKPIGAFQPTTPMRSTRYDQVARVCPGHTNILPAFCSTGKEPEPPYLPLSWSAHIQPEGQMYFSRQSMPRIVTDAHLYSTVMQERIASWIQVFEHECAERQFVPTDAIELYLEPLETTNACLYYLVDHATRVVFWLEEVSTDEVGLPPTATDSHLRIALEEHYWRHVEYFPSHRCQDAHLSLNDLKAIFLHSQVDQLTSSASTFPYTAEQCAQFMGIIQSAQECRPSGPQIASIARIWSLVLHHRITIHYGEQHARLSRDQSILDIPPVAPPRVFRLMSRLCFGVPEASVQALNALYVDNLVYEQPWQATMKALRRDWLLCASWALVLLIADILMLIVPYGFRHAYGPRYLALASMLICNTAVVSALILLVKHHWAPTADANAAATYLAHVQGDTSGFCWTALAFSLPKALLAWGLVLTSLHGFVWLAVVTSPYALFAMFFLLAAIGLCSGLLPLSWDFSAASLFARFRAIVLRHRNIDECAV